MPFQNIRFYKVQPSPYGAWGGSFRITAIVEHQGPEEAAVFRAAVGNKNAVFEELISGKQQFTFPAYSAVAAAIEAEPGWEARSPWCDVPIGTEIPRGTYDIYVSINGVSAVSAHSAVITGYLDLEFQNFQIALPGAIEVTAHSKVSVPVSFSYRVGDDVVVNLLTYVYSWKDGEIVPLLTSTKAISLSKSLDWNTWEGLAEIEIIPAEGGIGDGTYGLGAMIEGYSDQAQSNIDNCIIASGILVGFETWLPMSPLIGPPLPKWMGIIWPWYEARKT
ncbi:hypothetical protein ES703_112988 [subsurface metagenome]